MDSNDSVSSIASTASTAIQVNTSDSSTASAREQQDHKLLREKYLISRLDHREDDMSNLSDSENPPIASTTTTTKVNQQIKPAEPIIEESYDNLNSSSLINDDGDEDVNDFSSNTKPIVFTNSTYLQIPPPSRHSKTRKEFQDMQQDIQSKFNTESFIISKSLLNDSSNLSFNKSDFVDQQVSEEIEDCDDEENEVENDTELRNYDDDYNQTDQCGANEDEFF